jgi:hypothetical protein
VVDTLVLETLSFLLVAIDELKKKMKLVSMEF